MLLNKLPADYELETVSFSTALGFPNLSSTEELNAYWEEHFLAAKDKLQQLLVKVSQAGTSLQHQNNVQAGNSASGQLHQAHENIRTKLLQALEQELEMLASLSEDPSKYAGMRVGSTQIDLTPLFKAQSLSLPDLQSQIVFLSDHLERSQRQSVRYQLQLAQYRDQLQQEQSSSSTSNTSSNQTTLQTTGTPDDVLQQQENLKNLTALVEQQKNEADQLRETKITLIIKLSEKAVEEQLNTPTPDAIRRTDAYQQGVARLETAEAEFNNVQSQLQESLGKLMTQQNTHKIKNSKTEEKIEQEKKVLYAEAKLKKLLAERDYLLFEEKLRSLTPRQATMMQLDAQEKTLRDFLGTEKETLKSVTDRIATFEAEKVEQSDMSGSFSAEEELAALKNELKQCCSQLQDLRWAEANWLRKERFNRYF